MSAMKIKIKLKFTYFLSILSIFMAGKVSAEGCMSSRDVYVGINRALAENSTIVIAATSLTSPSSSFPIGSGVVYKRDGSNYLVVTANHVVSNRNSERYLVQTRSRTSLAARVIRRSSRLDIAILQFTSYTNIPVIQIGRSSNLNLFDNTYLLGWRIRGEHAEWEITEGGFNRRTDSLFDYSNASYYGMSGGAILDDECKLVGIHKGRNRTSNVYGQGIMVDSIREMMFPPPSFTFPPPGFTFPRFQIYAP